jgi:type IV pilus assembly protein PilN
MITINLLPVREERKKQELRGQAGLVVVFIAIACLCVVTVQASVASKVSASAREVAQLKAEKEQYKDQLAEVEGFKTKKKDIETKLGVIAELNDSRSGPVRILDELGNRTPNNLFIQKLITQDGYIEINGEGLNNEIVAEYLDALEESDYFDDVKLETIKRKKIQGLKVSSFEIRAKLTSPRQKLEKLEELKAPAEEVEEKTTGGKASRWGG